MRIRLRPTRESNSTFPTGAFKDLLDYVTRRFNASSAGLKKPVGLDLRWTAALRDLQIQLEPRVSRSEAAVPKRLVRMVPGSVRNWIAVNAVQQSNLNKK